MPAIVPQALPETALLQRYRAMGAHTDCFAVEVASGATLEAYVAAFYNSWAFRPERVLLGLLLGMRAGPGEVAALAAGRAERFSAWTVEAREADQILLCDFQHRTRSWLMVAPGSSPGSTRLHFGSAVVRGGSSRAARIGEATAFHGLMWFHALYSRVLLGAAASRLSSRSGGR